MLQALSVSLGSPERHRSPGTRFSVQFTVGIGGVARMGDGSTRAPHVPRTRMGPSLSAQAGPRYSTWERT